MAGPSWEGFALEVAARAIGKRHEELRFWATHADAQVDLFWQQHGKNWGVDLKYADAARLTCSPAFAGEDLQMDHLRVVYPGDRAYALAEKDSTLLLASIGDRWSYP